MATTPKREEATTPTKSATTDTAQQMENNPPSRSGEQLRRRLDWVVSYPKSGNTWCRLVAMCYATGRPDLQALGKGGDNQPMLYHQVSPIPLTQMGVPAEMQIRPAAMLNLAVRIHPQEQLLKSHHAFGQVAGSHLWQPAWTRKVVYPVRDPREVCCSANDHFGHDTYQETAEFMNHEGTTIGGGEKPLHHLITSWSHHVKSWSSGTGDIDVYIVRYEDLKQNPVDEFYDVLDFVLDEKVVEDKVEKAVQSCEFDRLQEIEDEHGFPEQSPQQEKFFRSGQTDGWKEELPTEVADKIIEDHGEMMEEMGYL